MIFGKVHFLCDVFKQNTDFRVLGVLRKTGFGGSGMFLDGTSDSGPLIDAWVCGR